MAPKKRSIARKRTFTDFQNEDASTSSQSVYLENANIEAAVDLQNYEVRYTEELEEYGETRDDKRMTKKNASKRRDFFEDFQNEGTSTDFGTSVGKNINIQILLDL